MFNKKPKYNKELFKAMHKALVVAEKAMSNEWLYQTGQFCRPQSMYPPQGSVHGSLVDAMGDIRKIIDNPDS